MAQRKKTKPAADTIDAMAEEASRELQRQADEADRELRKLISPLWDTAADGSGEWTL